MKTLEFQTKRGFASVKATSEARRVHDIVTGRTGNTPVLNWHYTYIFEMRTGLWTYDTAYQTLERSKRDAKLKENWRPEFVDPLVLNLRTDGTLYCIDGRHRTNAALDLGVPVLPVKLHIGLTMEDGARIFASQQDNTVKLTPREKFSAYVAAGKREYVAMAEILEAYGYGWSEQPAEHGRFSAVNMLMRIASVKGQGAAYSLEWILQCFARSGWSDQKHHTTDRWIKAFWAVCRDAEAGILETVDGEGVEASTAQARLVAAMREIPCATLATYANTLNVSGDYRSNIQSVVISLATGEATAASLRDRCEVPGAVLL